MSWMMIIWEAGLTKVSYAFIINQIQIKWQYMVSQL